jgi:hypothetical protein
MLTRILVVWFCLTNLVLAKEPLAITWTKNDLVIRGDFPGSEVHTNYLEAYCRPGSTDRDWKETVIAHKVEQLEPKDNLQKICLRDTLADGVIVDHTITSDSDSVTFSLTAHNPTQINSEAHWAQPCMRVDLFTGCGKDDIRETVPQYAKQCFLFLEGKPVRLPTMPWSEKARYIPGQVFCPPHVNRNDVNPRPLSTLVPSCSLCGCYSKDEKMILATAWEPYQEVFQGVIACIHCDFRLGGLQAGETKKIRGKVYVVPADINALYTRFQQDFPEQGKPVSNSP